MTTVVVTHAVGNMDTWLGGGDERKALFANFSSSHRIFRHTEEDDLVSIVWEDVDLNKMKALLNSRKEKPQRPRTPSPIQSKSTSRSKAASDWLTQ